MSILKHCIGLFALLVATSAGAELVHHYPFDSAAEDAVGSADGTLLNGAQVSAGLLVLDGIDDYVQFAEHIIPLSGDYTVAFFARQTQPQIDEFVELISQGFSTGPGFYLGHHRDGTIRAGDDWQNTGVDFPTDGKFHHYALVADAGNTQSLLYIDGLLRATHGTAITSTGEGTNTRLGSQFETGGTELEWFHGQMDDVRIYDTALGADEIWRLANIFRDGFEQLASP